MGQPGHQVIKDINTLNETGSSAELGIFIESDDVFSDETVAFVTDFANEELAARPEELLTASSMPTTVSFLLEVPDTTPLPPRGIDVERAYEVAPPDIQEALVNPDASALNLVFRTGPGSLNERAVYVVEIRELEAGETAGGVVVPEACGPRRPAWPWWAWACSRTSSRTASCSPTWPSCSSSCS